MQLVTDSPITRKQRNDKLEDSWKVRSRRGYPFVAWDGEGYSSNGKHHYALFGNSLGGTVRSDSLDYRQCLPLLLDSPKKAIHVIFAGTYDIVMMFRNEKERHAIMAGQWVSVGRYRLRFLKGKSLTVKDSVTKDSRTLYDVFSFFGCSFVQACREYFSPTDVIEHDGITVNVYELLEEVAAMKLQRADFTAMDKTILDYMRQELVLLARLCEMLRERLAAVNIHPSRWHGPGAVASAVLQAEKITSYRSEKPKELIEAAESAYYGGRFEMFARGTYLGDVYQYDIRSAYPYAMTHLPSLVGDWEYKQTGNIRVDTDYALYYVKQRGLSVQVPYRSQYGSIYFPDWAFGWYWGVELPKGIKAQKVWKPITPSVERPFSFVHSMYQRRATLKAEGKPEQLALKLALNSLYGKLAQSKGANWDGKRWKKPTYHEALWAGYITAFTRSMIQKAVSLAGKNCIAVETDAVFSTIPLDLPLGTGLGQWEETRYEGIKYLQSGVHMTLQDGKWSYKTRGLTMKRNQSESTIWDDLLDRGSIVIEQVRFGTDVRQANFGRWYRQRRKIVLDSLAMLEKRINVGPCALCHPDVDGFYKIPDYDTHLHRMVVPPIPMEPTTPYKFVWNGANPFIDPSTDDPILYLEYQPETLTESVSQ